MEKNKKVFDTEFDLAKDFIAFKANYLALGKKYGLTKEEMAKLTI